MRRIWSGLRGPLIVLMAGCLFASLVAGCSSDDPPPADPTHHPGTAPITTTTPTGNPEEVRAAAAIAAVQKLYAELNASLGSGSTAEYRFTFTRHCTACLTNANTIDRIHRMKQRIQGGTFHVSKLSVVWNKPDKIIVQGVLRSDPLTVRQGSRVVERDSGSPPTAFTWDAKAAGTAWLVDDVVVLK